MEEELSRDRQECEFRREGESQADVQATLSNAERELYAALVTDLPTLLPACNTWEDQLWAHVSHRLESRIDRRWHDLGGFWEQDDALLGGDDEVAVELGRGGLEEVFASISAASNLA